MFAWEEELVGEYVEHLTFILLQDDVVDQWNWKL